MDLDGCDAELGNPSLGTGEKSTPIFFGREHPRGIDRGKKELP